MTVQEMIDHVRDEIRNNSVDPKIVRWLNIAAIDICNNYVFGNLSTRGTLSASIGNPDVSIGTNLAILWVKSMNTSNRKLYPIDEQLLSEQFYNYRTLQGEVTRYYWSGGPIIGLYQVPSSDFTIDILYQRYPTNFTISTTNTDIPQEWHPYIAQRAITAGFRYEGNADGVAMSTRMETELLRRVATNVYRRPDDTLVSGGQSFSRKPAYPRLPSNFPAGS